MARDPRKQQEKAMKKRRKKKEAAKSQNQTTGLAALSARALVRNARKFPISACYISQDWQHSVTELVQIAVARQQPDGGITFGVYLVDMLCLGLKSTFCNGGFTAGEFRLSVLGKLEEAMPMESCPPELAHQIIYQAIDYAAQFGIKPDKDFKLSQLVLEPRGELPETYHLTFGKDGKPFFVAGPYDNVQAIVAKLEATAGPGNYEVMAMF